MFCINMIFFIFYILKLVINFVKPLIRLFILLCYFQAKNANNRTLENDDINSYTAFLYI